MTKRELKTEPTEPHTRPSWLFHSASWGLLIGLALALHCWLGPYIRFPLVLLVPAALAAWIGSWWWRILASGGLLLAVLGMGWLANQDGEKPGGWAAAIRPPIDPTCLRWACLLLFGGFLLVGGVASLRPVQAFERRIGPHVVQRSGPSITRAMTILMQAGDPDWALAVMIMVVLLLRRQGQALGFFACTWFGISGLDLCGKILFHRVHPWLFLGQFLSSYPSGTAMRAALLSSVLLILGGPVCCRPWQRGGLWSAAVGWSLLMSAAVVYAGWHTPTDVVGGLLLGVGWFGVSLQLLVHGSDRQKQRDRNPADRPFTSRGS